ncbi:unnamed protein product [Adineta steineri]|uniref:Runt domain-containing protein n=1 Tax=Adineta steineri TaxID=433720 RepID=A0A815Y851_9BILA|nr:unnamed protein product [Adineta steineri]CAF1667166.1 unnamed protein product [Adineta steineri]
MAYDGRRVSTESDKSSTSTAHSTESTTTYPRTPIDRKLYIEIPKTTGNKPNVIKRNSTMSSPAEIVLARAKNTFVELNPHFECSSLPNHWRKNKSLHFILRTKNRLAIKSNTRVFILAGNEFNPCATLKNNVSCFRNGQAEFNDLRFLAASGRGKKFTLSIIIETTPPQQCTYRRAIKITVDGPRKKRELKLKSDVNDTQADESNIDGDSDNESQTTSTSMNIDSKPTVNQGSSGLLLLAAAAEKKRNDEQDESSSYSYPSLQHGIPNIYNSLSPPSILASQFSHLIGFSPTSNDSTSRLIRRPNQSTISNSSPSSNLIFSLTGPNYFGIHYQQQQRRDQQTTSTNTSTSNTSTSTHVLCR